MAWVWATAARKKIFLVIIGPVNAPIAEEEIEGALSLYALHTSPSAVTRVIKEHSRNTKIKKVASVYLIRTEEHLQPEIIERVWQGYTYEWPGMTYEGEIKR